MGFLDSLLASFKKPSGVSSQKKKSEVKVTVTSSLINPLQAYASKPSLSGQLSYTSAGQEQGKQNSKPPGPPGTVSASAVSQSAQQEKPSGTGEQPKEDSKSAERMADIESKMQKLEIEMNKLSRDNETTKAKLAEIDGRLVEMLSMYELISNQMNPFVGDSKSMQVAVNDIKSESERLRVEFENLKANTESSMKEIKDRLNIISNDVNILSTSRVNVSSVIKTLMSRKNRETEKVRILQHVKNEMKLRERNEEVTHNGR